MVGDRRGERRQEGQVKKEKAGQSVPEWENKKAIREKEEGKARPERSQDRQDRIGQ